MITYQNEFWAESIIARPSFSLTTCCAERGSRLPKRDFVPTWAITNLFPQGVVMLKLVRHIRIKRVVCLLLAIGVGISYAYSKHAEGAVDLPGAGMFALSMYLVAYGFWSQFTDQKIINIASSERDKEVR